MIQSLYRHTIRTFTRLWLDGIAVCYEDGCLGEEIPLVENLGVLDGGMHMGLGSLSAYRVRADVFFETQNDYLILFRHISRTLRSTLSLGMLASLGVRGFHRGEAHITTFR